MAHVKGFVFLSILAVPCFGSDRTFPPGFKFGAGTSSYQIEGGWNAADKSENIWDRHCHAYPGLVKNNATGDIACDSYNKWKEDVQMTADLGLDFYRFSLSWSRILPTGFPDRISKTGVKYYSDLIDGLLERGIEPVVTIYHWDLPVRLQNFGGWTNPLIANWFADYARVVFSLYGDRVKTWITINEPIILCDAAFNSGQLAPSVQDPLASYLCSKNTLMAHARAWRIYDEEFKPKYKGRASLCNQLIWFESDSPENDEVAKLTRDLSVSLYSHPIYSDEGGWPPALEKHLAKNSQEEGYTSSKLPPFTKDEKEFVKGTYDFYALNYYTSGVVRKAQDGEDVGVWPLMGVPELGAVFYPRPEWNETGSPWFKIYPEGLRKQLRWLKDKYGDLEFQIMENGYPSVDQKLDDTERVKFIEVHLEQILLAIKEDGINVTAYTVWSLMDNFEWGDGYSIKFGLYNVDFNDDTRPRTPRASAKYYANVIKNHSLDFEERNILSEEL